MIRSVSLWLIAASSVVTFCWHPKMACAQKDLAQKAFTILDKNCYECHGIDDSFQGLDVHKLIIGDRGENRTPFVTAGNLQQSMIYSVISQDRMPPGDPLSQADKETIRNWIESGAEFPTVSRQQRPFISEAMVMKSILSDLQNSRSNTDRKYTRYFSLVHLHNNPDVTPKHLRYTRAALSKAINSMSREASIVVPRAIDTHQTIFALNIQDVGWDDVREYVWGDVLKAYPYGVVPRVVDDAVAFNAYESIIKEIGELFLDKVAHVRADWFVVAATRPPLYHTLAAIPDTLQKLEHEEGINMEQNFMRKQMVRSAVLKSGVSAQNRLVDRHEGRGGAFWISYDFGLNSGLSNIARFPLGPAFKDNKYNQHAFKEDGSEIVYERMNGMLGYMIADAEGNRIDRAPVSIVWNKDMKGGDNPEVVNGVTCMQCHRKGFRDFTDVLKSGHALQDPEATVFLLDIIPDTKTMQEKYLTPDSNRYMRKLEMAIGQFLNVEEDVDFPFDEFAEPVTEVLKHYNKPLTITDAACELGLEDVNKLKYANLRRLGLGVFAKERGVIQRTFWAPPLEQQSTGDNDPYKRSATSIFEDVVNKMDLGNPIKG